MINCKVGDIILWCNTRVAVVRFSPGMPTILTATEEHGGKLLDYLFVPSWVNKVIGHIGNGETIQQALVRGTFIVLYPPPELEMVAANSPCMNHRWKEYVGFTDSFKYCEVPGCDQKQRS